MADKPAQVSRSPMLNERLSRRSISLSAYFHGTTISLAFRFAGGTSLSRVTAGCALFICVPLFLASCNNDKIEVYRIPKESLNVAMERGNLVPAPPEHSAKWVKPAEWSEQPLSEMRLGSFKVVGPDATSADVSVVAFPGDAGGLVSNINRWRGQLELPPLEEEQLRQTVQQIEMQGAPVYLVDLQTAENSSKPSRILGAVLERSDRTWFVKMTGSPALLESQRQKFLDFVNSFRFDGSDQSGAPASPPKQKSTNDQ